MFNKDLPTLAPISRLFAELFNLVDSYYWHICIGFLFDFSCTLLPSLLPNSYSFIVLAAAAAHAFNISLEPLFR